VAGEQPWTAEEGERNSFSQRKPGCSQSGELELDFEGGVGTPRTADGTTDTETAGGAVHFSGGLLSVSAFPPSSA
jgi:hypothetical protein